jgi:DNA repair protein RadA/Sms
MAKPKTKTLFFCGSCGNESPKWLGRCPSCGEWNSFSEAPVPISKGKAPKLPGERVASRQARAFSELAPEQEKRISSGIDELDRALGGGVVPGSLVLIGGAPGIGKSTILLQLADKLAGKGECCLYISGEESAAQIKLRGERLGLSPEHLFLLASNSLQETIDEAARLTPALIIVDSIQTMRDEATESAPGNASQMRQCAALLSELARATRTAVFLVGHITKEGSIAGPKVIEHMVDTVLYFEGEEQHQYRLLRAVKNRYGPTNEIGVFEMTGGGLVEVSSPSEVFLGQGKRQVGTAVAAVIEGTRPLLVEVQALAAPAAYNYPQRVCAGIDYNRFVLLTAICEKRLGLKLRYQDLFLNLVGGLRVSETGLDLAAAMAVYSAATEIAPPEKLAFAGELGLSGEVRGVSRLEERIRETSRMGLTRLALPEKSAAKLGKKKLDGVSLVPLKDVSDAIRLYGKSREKK